MIQALAGKTPDTGLLQSIPRIFQIQSISGCEAFIFLRMGISVFSGAVFFGHMGYLWGNQWPMIISGLVLTMISFLILIQHGVPRPSEAGAIMFNGRC